MESLIHRKCHLCLAIAIAISPACWPDDANAAEVSGSASCGRLLVPMELSHV